MDRIEKTIRDIENLPQEIKHIVIVDLELARDVLEAKSFQEPNCLLGFNMSAAYYAEDYASLPQDVSAFYQFLQQRNYRLNQLQEKQKPVSAQLAYEIAKRSSNLSEKVRHTYTFPKERSFLQILCGFPAHEKITKEMPPLEYSTDWINSGLHSMLSHKEYTREESEKEKKRFSFEEHITGGGARYYAKFWIGVFGIEGLPSHDLIRKIDPAITDYAGEGGFGSRWTRSDRIIIADSRGKWCYKRNHAACIENDTIEII